MPVSAVGEAGDAQVRVYKDVQGRLDPYVRIFKLPAGGEAGIRLSLDESVDLARLLIKTAAANGWGSDEERQRLIAWAPLNRKT